MCSLESVYEPKSHLFVAIPFMAKEAIKDVAAMTQHQSVRREALLTNNQRNVAKMRIVVVLRVVIQRVAIVPENIHTYKESHAGK